MAARELSLEIRSHVKELKRVADLGVSSLRTRESVQENSETAIAVQREIDRAFDALMVKVEQLISETGASW